MAVTPDFRRQTCHVCGKEAFCIYQWAGCYASSLCWEHAKEKVEEIKEEYKDKEWDGNPMVFWADPNIEMPEEDEDG